MKFLNKVVNALPEIYFIASVLYYWSLTALLINPIAIALLFVLVFQTITKKRVLGIIIASILILASCYLVLALLSELSEFSEFNNDARKLALFGFLYLGLNIVFGGIMLYRYVSKKKLIQTNIISNS